MLNVKRNEVSDEQKSNKPPFGKQLSVQELFEGDAFLVMEKEKKNY